MSSASLRWPYAAQFFGPGPLCLPLGSRPRVRLDPPVQAVLADADPRRHVGHTMASLRDLLGCLGLATFWVGLPALHGTADRASA
jgi:hypothetical protein